MRNISTDYFDEELEEDTTELRAIVICQKLKGVKIEDGHYE